ncbi:MULTISPECIES: immunity protein YezG family protein [unclassified Crossiella]|uniref:immunity protein YezG family protein n=1 Tax=unclassified Crossiella TaxID=2620835 RepID=UPI001FFF28BB|nr:MULTISPECIES: hypothetical protein [unclassified Crossiella]MCK2243651.1 hypothetical protein [Crossiella sp. S99.2]MCK2257509.1 hypothetical protein [Crossiella sp. S99.1]
MDTVDDLYGRIGQALTEAAPTEWDTARIVVRMLASQSQIDVTYSLPEGGTTSREISFDALDVFEEIRELLALPGKGAWYTAVFEMNREGKYRVDFDYDRRPEFDFHVDDEDYFEDLEQYPRDPATIPAWMPNRA